MRNLIWLASYPKSGNTWVRMFIAAYLSQCEQMDLRLAKDYSKSESLLADFARVAGKPADELTPEDINEHRLGVQEHLSRIIGQRVVKTHNARLDGENRRLIFSRHTKAGVYIVRNPLDVVDSLADHTNKSVEATIRLMSHPQHRLGSTHAHAAQYVGTWSHHVRTWIRNNDEFPLLVLRYEELLADPYEQFAALVRFLGWEYDATRLKQAVEVTSFKSLQRAEVEGGFEETSQVSRSGKFFRHGEVERWQRVLSDDQAAQVIKDHHESMTLAGYSVPLLDSQTADKTTATNADNV